MKQKLSDWRYHRKHREEILLRKRTTYWNKPGERSRILAIRKEHDKRMYSQRRKSLHWNHAADAMIEDARSPE